MNNYIETPKHQKHELYDLYCPSGKKIRFSENDFNKVYIRNDNVEKLQELQKRIDKAIEFLYGFFAEEDGTIYFSSNYRRQLIEILLGVDVDG
jgi:dimeric dUTPase (all-alpha-NTP-PPase superfamily)